MTVEIEGVTLHLAHPDELSAKWVGQGELMRQLLAAWMVVNDQDLPMNPRLLGKPGVGKTTLAYAAARRQPALADSGQGIAIERAPGQQRVINAGPHDAGEYPLEDFYPGQPARREELFGQQPGYVVVELVGGQPVGYLDQLDNDV